MTLGPFDIDPAQVQNLGPRFTPFVNLLLDVEAWAQGLAGHQLTTNHKENLADGGVDAALRGAHESDWFPGGESAWQFKSGDLKPKQCADELRGAVWTHETIRAGGTYVLALGATLVDQTLENRRKALWDTAVELELLAAEADRDRIRVYDANKLARWASTYPAMARSTLLDGVAGAAVDFERWAAGPTHAGIEWVADDARAADIGAIRSRLATPGAVELRLQGDSGIGKTRLALEALRDPSLAPLVVYIHDERDADGALFNQLLDHNRVAILVIDECPAEQHVKLFSRLTTEAEIKLVTIGDVGSSTTRSPVFVVDAMPDDKLEEFLRNSHPLLRPEALRFVVNHCRGNIRWAIALAGRIADLSEGQAAELIDQGDIRTFVATFIPEGDDFFLATLLALLERVGWDDELAPQLELLAGFAHVPVSRLRDVGSQLERQGLLSRQGRYRAVAPHPAAVFLAADAWRGHGNRIVNELLPALDPEMALSLFRRVADLGRFEPAVAALTLLLSSEGPFATLDTIEARRIGPLLTQLAIVLPDEVTRHLNEAIESEPIEQLRSRQSGRRDLVWTLEKLAWHQRTFELAANSLLRLALAENETYGNNATGTWLSLFATLLPSTAASPAQRIAYLTNVSQDEIEGKRLLAVKGAAKALGALHMESTMVSAEVQGGVLVEPRGRPQTYGDAADYRRAMLSVLSALTADQSRDVAVAAEDALISQLHPLTRDPFIYDDLVDALVRLRGPALRRLRSEAEHLLSLHERAEAGDQEVIDRVNSLLARLPAPTDLEALAVLAHLPRWDLGQGELRDRIDVSVGALTTDDIAGVFALLDESVPAAWEIGKALATHHPGQGVVDALVARFEPNPIALLGYLAGRVDNGEESAFDEFLSAHADDLTLKDQVAVAARGPATALARERVLAGARMLPVADAAAVVFGWQPNLSENDEAELVDDWLSRLSTQADYNALIDRLMTWLFNEERVPDWARSRVARAVLTRREFPGERGAHNYGWSRLALASVPDHGLELAQLIFDLIESHDLMLIAGYDVEVLVACAQQHPREVWDELSGRLEAGAWRVEMQVRGSVVVPAFPTETIEDWIGDDLERARVAASVTPVESEEPRPLVRYLLDHFGDDEVVGGRLASTFTSGGWTGPESGRIATQLAQLNGWRDRAGEPAGLRSWAARMVESLEAQRQAALQREAEGRF